jgi:hypothetical protein
MNEWEEPDGVFCREFIRKMYHRTLPLPEGTRVSNQCLLFRSSGSNVHVIFQFEEIHAQMTGKGLILRYPNMRCYRVDARSRSGDS